jgi:hypothetical protein
MVFSAAWVRVLERSRPIAAQLPPFEPLAQPAGEAAADTCVAPIEGTRIVAAVTRIVARREI